MIHQGLIAVQSIKDYTLKIGLPVWIGLLVITCQPKNSGSTAKVVDKDSLRHVAQLLDGRWKTGSNEGVRYSINKNLYGTSDAYTFENGQITAVRSYLSKFTLSLIKQKPAIIFKTYVRDTLFITTITKDTLVMKSDKKTIRYSNHQLRQ